MLPHIDPVDLPEIIWLTRWCDPGVEARGHPVVSDWCETWWLPTLGPTTMLLARRLAPIVANVGDGMSVQVPLLPLAESLGIKRSVAKNGPLARSVARLQMFGVAELVGDVLRVRSHLPPLDARQVKRLPAHLAALVKAEVSA